MHLKKGKDLTLLCHELFQFWSDVKVGITISELRVINKIFYYYDKNIDCGHKELVADLNIPSSALSKLLKNWMLDSGTITAKKSITDKRRNYYYPSKEYIALRENFLNKITIKISSS
jgi:DNA-binding MarR family transcriptional regulator